MNNSKLSSIEVMRIMGCLIFDIAIVLAFFKIFGLFFIVAPGRSILVLLVLFVGLISINGGVIFPSILFKHMGIPYSVSVSTVLVLYAIIANVTSIILIPTNIVWYLVCELIIFAIFIIIFSVIASFAKVSEKELVRVEKEQSEKALIMMQLLEIERTIAEREDQEAILPCTNSFNALKERIKASTPFGRIIGNSAVLEVEDQIKNNLVTLKIGFQENLTDDNLIKLQRLLEDTRRLVINRETLNIK